MAILEIPIEMLKKSKKRKSKERLREIIKKQRLSSHKIGLGCNCIRLKCFHNVKEEDRKVLTRYFNSLSSKDAQDSYLASLITLNNVSRRRPRNINSKGYNSSYTYRLFITNHEIFASSFVYVCFSAFISIFGIKKGRLETIKRSLLTTGHSPHDKRGKHKNQYNNFTPQLKNKICDHISSFRGRESHYSQKKTRRLYLPQI
nr:uncharacterized protein LOC105847750 [Hydra vulgaris]